MRGPDLCVEFQLGARGLRSICEAVMTDALFEIPSHKGVTEFEVTLEYCAKKLSKDGKASGRGRVERPEGAG